jgi:hypothetical protein
LGVGFLLASVAGTDKSEVSNSWLPCNHREVPSPSHFNKLTSDCAFNQAEQRFQWNCNKTRTFNHRILLLNVNCNFLLRNNWTENRSDSSLHPLTTFPLLIRRIPPVSLEYFVLGHESSVGTSQLKISKSYHGKRPWRSIGL